MAVSMWRLSERRKAEIEAWRSVITWMESEGRRNHCFNIVWPRGERVPFRIPKRERPSFPRPLGPCMWKFGCDSSSKIWSEQMVSAFTNLHPVSTQTLKPYCTA